MSREEQRRALTRQYLTGELSLDDYEAAMKPFDPNYEAAFTHFARSFGEIPAEEPTSVITEPPIIQE